MLEWVVFAHVLGAMLRMLTHGASAAVALRPRRERDDDAIRRPLRLAHATTPAAYSTLLLLVGAGLLAAMTGRWLSAGWLVAVASPSAARRGHGRDVRLPRPSVP